FEKRRANVLPKPLPVNTNRCSCAVGMRRNGMLYILKLRCILRARTGIFRNMQTQEKLRFLEDKWDERVAGNLDAAELLRYRSNILGSDLRITNFGGGNTSSKLEEADPLDGSKKTVLWIKGSGGDIGSI